MYIPHDIEVVRYVSKQKRSLLFYTSQFIWNVSHMKIYLLTPKFIRIALESKWNRFLNNRSVNVKDINGTILTDLPEAYSLIGLKTRMVVEYLLKNYDFDFLYRTNVSSYIDLAGLLKFVQNLDTKTEVYMGVIGKEKHISFASGSGYLISRPTLEKFARHFKSWDHFQIDDVALGKIAKLHMKIEPLPMRRTDIINVVTCTKEMVTESNTFHFRCKSHSPLETIKIMKLIRAYIND